MEQLMLINPSARPSKRKKPRSAAQKAATRRMVAARRSASKAPATRSKRRAPSRVMQGIKKRMKSRRKNPIGGGIASMFMPAAKGAIGAVAINTLETQVLSRFLPGMMQGDIGKYGTRIALAIALGTMGGRIIGNANARQAAEGALVVALHDVIVTTVNKVLPAGVGLAAYAPNFDTPAPARGNRLGAYSPLAGMGKGATSPYEFTS